MILPWHVPKMWDGGECWIIGGGPSIPLQFDVPEDVISAVLSGEKHLSSYSPFLAPIHEKHIIGVNAAFLLGTWIDIVFFGDSGFYFLNKEALNAFPKIKVTSNIRAVRKNIQGVKYMPQNKRHPDGISNVENTISWNLNSGAAAISLAHQLGVKKIYLLGFDMDIGTNGNQHWHQHYAIHAKRRKRPKKPNEYPFARHLKCFPAVANDARRLGLEIINVSPNSKIKEFRRVALSDVL